MEDVVADAQRWSGRPVLVTGCTGLIGAWLSNALCAAGVQVVGIARSPAKAASAFVMLGLEERVDLRMLAIEDAAAIHEVLAEHRPVAIFHLAGTSQVGAAHAFPLDAMGVNVGGSAALVEGVRRVVPAASVVFASTTAVYGVSSGGADAPAFNENSPLAPSSAYGGSKAAAEMIAQAYAASYGLAIVALRCTNVYGPGDPNLARLVPSLIDDLVSGRTPRLRSNGTTPRDYLFVDDAVRAFVLAAACLEGRVVPGGAFNLAGGVTASALEMTQLLGRLTGRPAVVPETGAEAESAPATASAARAHAQLGWMPRWTLEEGLRRTVHCSASNVCTARGEGPGGL
jgi:CDP-glucose 4,6-dehydratase